MSIYQKFCHKITDEHGNLKKLTLDYPENFNFGYDVVDAIAKETPDKKALVWCNIDDEERIFTFAKTLADGNPEMFETMKNAFLTGFSQAEGVKGGKGKLPGVCYETYSKVMDKFDKWEKELNGTAETEETASSAE